MIYITASIAFLSVLVFKFVVFKKEVVWWEVIAGGLIAGVFAIGAHVAGEQMYLAGQTSDNELWHGYVTDKEFIEKRCGNYGRWSDWSDSFCTNEDWRTVEYNCRRVTDSDGHSRRVCNTKTQYRSRYPSEGKWYVKSTLGDYQISRVDRRGLVQPDRYKTVLVNDPVTKTNGYTNWLLVPNNAFEYAPVTTYTAPSYPKVNDYYNTHLVFNETDIDTSTWNDKIREFLNTKGYEKQVNVIVHVTDKPSTYFDSVMYQWNGGKKNDVVMFFGVKNGKLDWFKSTSFAKGYGNRLLHDKLHDMHVGTRVNDNYWDFAIDASLSIVNDEFKRYPMEHMNHIKDSIKPPMGLIIFIQILAFAIGGGACYVFAQNSHRE